MNLFNVAVNFSLQKRIPLTTRPEKSSLNHRNVDDEGDELNLDDLLEIQYCFRLKC